MCCARVGFKTVSLFWAPTIFANTSAKKQTQQAGTTITTFPKHHVQFLQILCRGPLLMRQINLFLHIHQKRHDHSTFTRFTVL